MALFSRRSEEAHGQQPLLTRAADSTQADFIEAETAGSYAVLRWETAWGGVGLAHHLSDGNGSPGVLLDALYTRYVQRTAQRYACVVVAQAATQSTEPYVPRLVALDITGEDAAYSDTYEVTWQQLAAVLGTRAPCWLANVRDAETITSWRPGAPPAVVPACHPTNPIGPLAELAAHEPDGSPAAQVCWALAREIRRRDHDAVTEHVQELRENAADGGDGAHLVLGAVPAELLRPEKEDEDPPEMVRRAGWLAITQRRDVLAHRVANLSQRWDGGQDWHTGDLAAVQVGESPAADEWIARLVPADRDQAPTVLERELLDNARDLDNDLLLQDPVTGIPALRRRQRWDKDRPEDLFTMRLQRLLTHAPLAELIVSGETAWIRTEDGTLWFAPARIGYGVSWGYGGTGNMTLAVLLDRLLDDITAPAVAARAGEPPQGLEELLRATPQEGTTTYSRAQLLAARAG